MYALTTAELMDRPDLWRAVHALRHEVFVDEIGLEYLRRPNGLEVDAFDHDEAVHHLVFRDGALAGYQRLLPTTRPHLLTTVLRDLFVVAPPCGPNVFEITRRIVARSHRGGRRGVATVGNELIAGLIEWSLARGVDSLVIALEPSWVLRALQLHFIATPLGYQRTRGRRQLVATLLAFDRHTLHVVRSRSNHFTPVLCEGLPGDGSAGSAALSRAS
jgi:acyl-homoserine lactone synthase